MREAFRAVGDIGRGLRGISMYSICVREILITFFLNNDHFENDSFPTHFLPNSKILQVIFIQI